MALYTNHTRFPAIVTVDVISVIDAKASLKIVMEGVDDSKVEAGVGHHDFLIEAGKGLDLGEGSQVKLFAVRSCP